ncbi:MAG: hypothetical protein H0T46_18045 [Deltaproteobacteria bacterium]|nr:hypothetical protein [Deltaproteobacteria bacterium]
MDPGIQRLAERGYDIAHAFDAHAAACEPGWEHLARGPRVGILIGNTRALWEPFLAAANLDEADPLDRYTERAIAAAFGDAPAYFTHREHGGAFLPFSRLAVATGLGALAPSHLVIHPIYGPWLALRAVVLVDGEPPARSPIPKPCTCAEACATALAAALPSTRWEDWLAVRDACPLRTYRYSVAQIRYHYSKAWGRSPRGG